MPSEDESPTSDLLLSDDEEASTTFTSPVARRTRSRADHDLNMATSVPIFDKDLSDILLRIFQIDVTETPLHEVAEGLANDRITTWDYFLEATIDDILAITKKSRNDERVTIIELLKLKKMQTEKSTTNKYKNTLRDCNTQEVINNHGTTTTRALRVTTKPRKPRNTSTSRNTSTPSNTGYRVTWGANIPNNNTKTKFYRLMSQRHKEPEKRQSWLTAVTVATKRISAINHRLTLTHKSSRTLFWTYKNQVTW